jgi:predicted nuclease with TOPRIM domain
LSLRLTLKTGSRESHLNDFVVKEYVKTKTLEETFLLINELQAIEKKLADIQNEIENIKKERTPIEQEIAGIEQKTTELQTKGPIDQLNVVNAEVETINNDLKMAMRHLQKPFIKMQALATSGGGAGVTPDELHKLNEYLESPFEALVKEEQGYPVLKQVLQKLGGLLKEDKLKLKPEKARKAEQSIVEINIKDALVSLQEKAAKVSIEKTALLNSAHLDETKRSLSAFQGQVDSLKARKTSIEAHEAIKEHEYKDLQEKINNSKRSLERSVLAALNKKIQLA